MGNQGGNVGNRGENAGNGGRNTRNVENEIGIWEI